MNHHIAGALLMSSLKTIEEFFSLPRLAVVGVSRSGKGFGASAFRTLKGNGLDVTPINRSGGLIDGIPLVNSLRSLAGKIDGVVIVTPPDQSVSVIDDAIAAGVRQIWFQPGSDSPDAFLSCNEAGLSYVHKECVLMFAPPVKGGHYIHSLLRRLMGRMPAVE